MATASVNTAASSEIAPHHAYESKAYLTQSDTYSKHAKNQLPSLGRVTTVVIDAGSVARLAGQFGADPPPL